MLFMNQFEAWNSTFFEIINTCMPEYTIIKMGTKTYRGKKKVGSCLGRKCSVFHAPTVMRIVTRCLVNYFSTCLFVWSGVGTLLTACVPMLEWRRYPWVVHIKRPIIVSLQIYIRLFLPYVSSFFYQPHANIFWCYVLMY